MKRMVLTLLLFTASISAQSSFSQDPGEDYPLIFTKPVPLRDVFPVNGMQMNSPSVKPDEWLELRTKPIKFEAIILPSLPDLRTPSEIEKSSQPKKIPLTYYTILSKSTGLAMAVSAAGKNNGEKIILWSANNGDEQKWELRPAKSGYFHIIAKHSGKFLAIREADNDEGVDAIQWKDNGGDEQLWKLQMDADGYARIIARHSRKCLSTAEGSGASGQSLVQRKRIDSDGQKWIISVSEIKWIKAKK